FAFSGDNWQRPANEVIALLDLVESYLLGEAANCASSGVRIRVIGRRDRIPPSLKAAIEAAEALTSHGRALELRDRKSKRLKSSHVRISYAVFCLKKKKQHKKSHNICQHCTSFRLPNIDDVTA